jgi:hypothetical protein
MLKTAIIQAYLASNAEHIAIVVATLLNVAVLMVNVSLGRSVRRRHRALIRSEQRGNSGPVTSAMSERFVESTARKR